MDDKQILQAIGKLVDEEHELRRKAQFGQIDTDDEHDRLRSLEESLDQCWDLLRQRRAARETGGDPERAQVRPSQEVEGYLQ